jgi:hypothetical protein
MVLGRHGGLPESYSDKLIRDKGNSCEAEGLGESLLLGDAHGSTRRREVLVRIGALLGETTRRRTSFSHEAEGPRASYSTLGVLMRGGNSSEGF